VSVKNKGMNGSVAIVTSELRVSVKNGGMNGSVATILYSPQLDESISVKNGEIKGSVAIYSPQ
jgi:antitoxin component YwqK of YwqJK toxin-antitoxin module